MDDEQIRDAQLYSQGQAAIESVVNLALACPAGGDQRWDQMLEKLDVEALSADERARHLRDGESPALMIVSGPDGYISPDWYGEEDRVPTWNYVAVHLRGTLRLLDHEGLRAHLDRLSANFEERLLPKKPWKTDKVTPETLDKLLRQIVPVEFDIAHVDSTFKFGQNRGASQVVNAAKGLEAGGTPGSETLALAALMRAAADA